MAGGDQCASTSELWSVWEVMSPRVGSGQCGAFSLCAMLCLGELATGGLALQYAGTTEMSRCCVRVVGVCQLLAAVVCV